jgi:hypothetical protein
MESSILEACVVGILRLRLYPLMKNPIELGLGSGGEVGHKLDVSYSHFPILVAEIVHHWFLDAVKELCKKLNLELPLNDRDSDNRCYGTNPNLMESKSALQ